MTARRAWWVQCREKVDYGSRAAARRARRCVARETLLHIYRCPWCGGVHLGNNPESIKHRPVEVLEPLSDLELAKVAAAVLRCSVDEALGYIVARPAIPLELVGATYARERDVELEQLVDAIAVVLEEAG